MTTHQTMGEATSDAVAVRGRDLSHELIGRITFTDMVALEIQAQLPGEQERRILDAVLVALTEHGLTPTAVVARLTDLGAPGALQGAVAAGLLGAGDHFLGALDGCGRILQEWPEEADPQAHARTVVTDMRAAGFRIPGLGHPTHKDGDPRTRALYALADETELPSLTRDRLDMLREAAEEASGRALPVNVDGAGAALLSAIGLPWQILRGIALVARTAGLVGHLWDETSRPTAAALWAAAEAAAPYRAPSTG
ncbi:citryl-CoA lyase [Leucobacter sp. CSA1]|uniref:citrate synthase (unknown stereospecificity) n=1 Tax=Leucobacter chromiisoli TaxID=2796471 RepID=A0A934Q5K6_9MICO|nr:citryl-CoA lyase [Leucobacter chromiisoli]MBK0418815.1 citryl-CoA lyase [Leucobacter chromiisoli]